MNQPTVIGIFPTPVLCANINRPLYSEEIQSIENFKKDTAINVGGNLTSTDQNVLDNINLTGIKEFIEKQIQIFITDILCPQTPMNLKITQSWLNWTTAEQQHYLHMHPNSYLSGVFYIKADGEADRIIFEKIRDANNITNCNIDFDVNEMNPFNSRQWWIPTNTGDLLLFPSGLLHQVPIEKSRRGVRTSLAFNTWFASKTILGSKHTSSLLEI